MTRSIENSDVKIDVIYITFPNLIELSHQSRFILECSNLLKICRKSSHLKLIILEYSPKFQAKQINNLVSKFQQKYKWRIKQSFEQFTDYNDRIDDGCHIAMMFNTNMIKPSSNIGLGIPKPPNVSNAMFESIYKDFNKRQYNISSFPPNYNFEYEMFKGTQLKIHRA